MQVSVQSAVQITAELSSYFSGLNNFAVHHPEPMAKPRTSLHSSLQRVGDIAYTSCFLSRPAMGNLQVTDEEADMLHPSHSVRKQYDHAEKLLFQCSPKKVKKSHLSHAHASAGFSQSFPVQAVLAETQLQRSQEGYPASSRGEGVGGDEAEAG